jgi:hypothetical protein
LGDDLVVRLAGAAARRLEQWVDLSRVKSDERVHQLRPGPRRKRRTDLKVVDQALTSMRRIGGRFAIPADRDHRPIDKLMGQPHPIVESTRCDGSGLAWILFRELTISADPRDLLAEPRLRLR